MELNFKKHTCSCMDAVFREVRSTELTQEIKLPDSMPDAGRVISAWGQPILRGKEWRGDGICVSGGLMVWVLYQPDDGSAERCIDTWIPFQMQWQLTESVPDGDFRVRFLVRFVDGRNVSARKIMVRAGIGALGEAYVPRELELFQPDILPENVELLQSTYPVRMPKEAGEKSFEMEETLTLPDSAPKPEAILYYRMNPKVTDRKVLSGKMVFRGNGNLHVLYRSEEGQVHSWDFELPFSQYTDLNREHSADAQADLAVVPTGLELDLDDEGQLQMKGSMVGQYLITDKEMLNFVEDAYSPGREMDLQTRMMEIPAVLESRRENLYGEQTLSAEANLTPDVTFLPDFPRQRRRENGVDLAMPGTFQVLYYGEDGRLRSGTARWEGQQYWNADENSQIQAVPMTAETQAVTGNGQILAKTELPLEMTVTTRQQFPMVTGLELGEQKAADPGRPSLILRRAGHSRLWDIARSSGSTMEAIRQANGFREEPEPGQMLLIPVN